MSERARNFILHVIASVLFLSLPVIFSPYFSASFRLLSIPPFQRDFMGYALVLVFFYLNYFMLLPKLYFKGRYLLFGAGLLVSYAVIAFLPYILIPAHSYSADMPMRPPHTDNTLLHMVGQHLFQFLIVISFSLLLLLNRRYRIAEREKVKAELSYLKAQINPHFLFNTLNSIYSLSIERSDKTSTAIVELSNLMRYVTTEANRPTVHLNDEIVYLTNYINLQILRLGDTTKVDFKLEGKMDDGHIAPLLLMPFIENAFKYGINPEWSTFIRISVKVTEDELHLKVFNLVANDDKTGSGLGIKNAQARLETIYPNRYSLIIIDEKSEYTVDLKIQLHDKSYCH